MERGQMERVARRRPDGERRPGRWLRAAAVVAATAAALAAPPAVAAAQDRFTIVSIGDSFGSGEGNPEQPGEHAADGELIGRPERWGPTPDAQRCHRSPLAHGARAADLLRARFPRLPITFIHVACSGASITAGLLGPYAGVEPSDGVVLDPQLTQVNRALRAAGVRRADALVVNIGVNDIGFGDLVTACVALVTFDCNAMEGTVEHTRAQLSALGGRFEALQAAIAGRRGARSPLAALPGRTYLVEYPDPTRDDDGEYCHQAPAGDLLARITRNETRWVSEEIVPALNQRLREAVDNAGAVGLTWEYVGGNVDDFARHGYCARDRFLNTNADALLLQGADAREFPVRASNGVVHPNGPGHAAVAQRVADAIARQIADEYEVGTPTLAVAGARARSIGVAPRIDLVWSAPSSRPIDHYELQIRRAERPGRTLRTVRVAGTRNGTSHASDGSGAFIYRLRACSRASCSPFSLAVRGSNLHPSELGQPRNLRRVLGTGLGAQRLVRMRWDRADDRWSFYELQHRRIQPPADGQAPALTRAQQGELQLVQRAEPQLGRRLGGLLRARLQLDGFSALRATDETATVGSPLHPLNPDDSYELRVRACTDVGCAAPTAAILEPVTRPSERIGELELDRIQQPVPAPGTFTLGVRGRLASGHRDLGALTVRFTGPDGELARVTYDHGRDRLTLAAPASSDPSRPCDRCRGAAAQRRAGRPAPARRAAGRVGGRATLRVQGFALDLRRTRVRARQRQLELRLALRLPARLRGGRIGVEAAAADRRGHRQPFAPVGALLMRR